MSDTLLELDGLPAALAEVLGLAVQTVMEKLTTDLHAKIVLRTPVDTGRARASWNISEGAPDLSVPPATKRKALKGGRSRSRELKAAAIRFSQSGTASTGANVSGKQEVFIVSGLEYMQYLEEGSSKQAPAGMVRISLAEIEAEIELILEGMK